MAARSLIATALLLALAAIAPAAELGRVAAFEDLRIDGEVRGDVVVLGGDIELAAGARVDGDVIAVLGRVERHPEARVGGRELAVTSLASLQVAGPSGLDGTVLDTAVRVLSSGGWLLVTTALAFVLPARFRAGTRLLVDLGPRALLLGVAAWATLFAALVAVLGLGPGLGPPLAAAVMIAFFALKAMGLATVGAWLGRLPPLGRGGRRWPLTYAVFVGVAVLLVVRLIPVVGGPLWTVVSVLALGVGVVTLLVGEAAPAGGVSELSHQRS